MSDKNKRKKQYLVIYFTSAVLGGNFFFILANNINNCQDNSNGVNYFNKAHACNVSAVGIVSLALAGTISWVCQSFDLLCKVVFALHTDKWFWIYTFISFGTPFLWVGYIAGRELYGFTGNVAWCYEGYFEDWRDVFGGWW